MANDDDGQAQVKRPNSLIFTSKPFLLVVFYYALLYIYSSRFLFTKTISQ